MCERRRRVWWRVHAGKISAFLLPSVHTQYRSIAWFFFWDEWSPFGEIFFVHPLYFFTYIFFHTISLSHLISISILLVKVPINFVFEKSPSFEWWTMSSWHMNFLNLLIFLLLKNFLNIYFFCWISFDFWTCALISNFYIIFFLFLSIVYQMRKNLNVNWHAYEI